ncbi:MAG: type II secretion system F family protein [Thermoleophilia bacterium]|nr:type II secretion system F family protein [Thermoleophilia bacterium]
MTATALIVSLLAGGLLIAAGRDLLRSMAGPTSEHETSRAGTIPAAAKNLGLPDRLRRAGRETVNLRSVLLAKAFAAAAGVMTGLTMVSLLPPRLGPPVVIAAGLGGFFGPDLMLERAARQRHRRMVTALPDALDLLSVSVATGRSLGASLSELSVSGRGPLAGELARAGQDMAWGTGQRLALDGLRYRIAGKEIASLTASLERSRKLGSPLADQLRRQSAGLRQDQRRAIEEEAARAAPKIQLVIALVLVPSVLMLIVAGLVANSDAIFSAGLV